jgi:hypothetical protein
MELQMRGMEERLRRQIKKKERKDKKKRKKARKRKNAAAVAGGENKHCGSWEINHRSKTHINYITVGSCQRRANFVPGDKRKEYPVPPTATCSKK